MDPLSCSASIGSLIQVAVSVINYLSDVRNGPQELKRIRLEVSSIVNILMTLQDQVNETKQDEWFSSSSSSLKVLSLPHGPFAQFREALERLSLKLAPADGLEKIKKSLTWPLEKKEIYEILDVIERQKANFNLARQNDHIALTRIIGKNIDKGINEITTELSNLQTSGRHQDIYRWLSAPDPSWNYNEALKNRHTSTGDWFLKTDAYSVWLSKPGHLLWLYGIPGCGKTILCSTIIENTKSCCQSQKDSVMLYFYFDFSDVEKQHSGKMIRSLLIQLSSQSIQMPDVLESLYFSCRNGECQPTSDSLLMTFHQLLKRFKAVYLVIDALDECSDRRTLLEDIDRFCHWQDANLHILLTSRREKEIEESIEPLCNDHGKICIQSMLINDDIRSYIRSRLQTDQGLKRWQGKLKTQLEIENTLMEKTDGMFRWAACQLDSLRDCLNLRELRKTLKSLPKTLDDTYIRILTSVKDDHLQYVLKILQWLTFSARPLELEELAEIVAIDVQSHPRFDPENRFSEPRDVFLICSSLVSLETQKSNALRNQNNKNIVKLAHFSVKEFLLSERILQGEARKFGFQEVDANLSIYNDCLAYLLNFDESDILDFEIFDEFPLARYAAQYWTRYARELEKTYNFDPSLGIELLLTKNTAFQIVFVCTTRIIY